MAQSKPQNLENQLAGVHAAVKESGASSFEEATAKAKSELDKFSHVTVNIAVTGVSGTGKSSFVNAIRGIPDDGEGAAPTDEVECTVKVKKYPHPSMPNVNFWDLPGIGTELFKANTYLETVHFNTYDCFIIIVGNRVTENDSKLVNEIRANGKNVYIIRSKIDQAVEAGKRKGKTEEETIKIIRDDLENKLDEDRIFLVSSWHMGRFDFSELINVLANDLSENKRDALIQSLPVYSMESLKKKYKAFQKVIWAQSFASAAVGAIPIPGVSAAFDVPAVAAFLTKAYFSFGLNDKCLKELSDRMNKPIYAKVHQSKLIKALSARSMTCLAVELSSYMALKGLQAALKFIPIIGSVTGATLSFTTTQIALRTGLKELYNAAKEVVEMAGLA